MITPEEIVDMTDLTPDEVAAIGEHEDVSEIVAAAALADFLMHQCDGPRTVRRMIREDMRDALRAGIRPTPANSTPRCGISWRRIRWS